MRALILCICLMIASCSSSPTRSDDSSPTTATDEQTRAEKALTYPETPREKIVETIHGIEVHDPYRWLEDEATESVQAWMEAQDVLARDYLLKQPGRDALDKRFRELFYLDSVSAPQRRGDRVFYTRRHADREKTVYYWRSLDSDEEQVLLDPNEMSPDGTISVRRTSVSYDGKLVAYLISINNADHATIHLMNVETGEVSDIDVIEGARYASPSWKPDSSGFYYTWIPTDEDIPVDQLPGHMQVRYHEIGTDPKDDPVILPALHNPEVFQGAALSRDGRHLFRYVSHGWRSNDVYVKRMDRPDADWVTLKEGENYNYEVSAWGNHYYIRTNEGADRYRLMRTHIDRPAPQHWEVIVPEYSDGSVIDAAQIIGNRLVVTLSTRAFSRLRIYELDGSPVREIELPGIGVSLGMTGNPEDDTAYFSFSSFTQPTTIYETSVETGKTETFFALEVPVDPEPYLVEQVRYPSKDGTEISMFIVRHRDTELNGDNPVLLYGYGGFRVNIRPNFSGSLYPWLEAGGIYAAPNLRGGGEYGQLWHRAGMLENKQNTFDDFIAAAEFLIAEGYTRPERLAIRGGSNGGLLVGAAMVQRPELFAAVVCAVPLLDMVRFHLSGSGRTWISEYGSADNPEQFPFIYAYSPYHHVKDATYPAMLMLTADSDDRVDPNHARKFTAMIQHHNQGDNPVLMRVERNAGHGGADLVSAWVERFVDEYTFLFDQLGMH